jgi:hypothetical protein
MLTAWFKSISEAVSFSTAITNKLIKIQSYRYPIIIYVLALAQATNHDYILFSNDMIVINHICGLVGLWPKTSTYSEPLMTRGQMPTLPPHKWRQLKDIIIKIMTYYWNINQKQLKHKMVWIEPDEECRESRRYS